MDLDFFIAISDNLRNGWFIMSRLKSMKISDYFQIIKPEYVYLQLKPANSIRNYNSDKIAKAIQHMYKHVSQRVKREGFTVKYKVPDKVSYYIYIEKGRVEFYFIVPRLYLSLIKEKINDTWKGITIIEVTDIPVFTKEATAFSLTYVREDALTLAVDKRTNTLLGSTLSVIDVMEDGDKVGIYYNFIPTLQFPWRAMHEETLDKIKNNRPIDRQKLSVIYVAKLTVLLALDLVNLVSKVLSDFFGNDYEEFNKDSVFQLNILDLDKQKTWSPATAKKKEKIVLDTQIVVSSLSKDKNRQINNAISVCEGFKSISEDNELVYKPYRIKDRLRVDALKVTSLDTIKMSVDECQNLIALPGREILEEYKCIDKIDTLENEVPIELQNGDIGIGTNTFRGNKTKAFLTSDPEYKNLTVTVIAPPRAGKTTFFQNVAKDAINSGQCVVIPDFISWCKFSSEISEVIPKSQQLIIDCEDYDSLQGFAFNELWINTNKPLVRYDSAKRQTAQLLTLVDGINAKDKNLSAKMDNYLESAALLVFSQYGTLKDVFDVLRYHKIRYKYISQSPKELHEYLEEYIDNLYLLDEIDRDGNVIGTKVSAISGILDRTSRLKRNTAMEIMLKKGNDNSINLVNEIQKPQLIVIRMPDSRFSTKDEKDFMCTYWFSKLWLALQLRDRQVKDRSQRVPVNIIFDELYQIPYTQGLLADKLSQIPKFDARPFISCHHLEQVGIIRSELKSANSNYFLISGCDKNNFKELKSELYPYEEEHLLNLKRYESLNLIKCNDGGYAKFITKLPPVIKKTKRD